MGVYLDQTGQCRTTSYSPENLGGAEGQMPGYYQRSPGIELDHAEPAKRLKAGRGGRVQEADLTNYPIQGMA